MELLLAALLVVSWGHATALSEGERCKHEAKGVPGTCRKVPDCPSAVADLSLGQVSPQICGFIENQRAIVCCPDTGPNPEEDVSQREQPGSIARRMCLQYAAVTNQKGYCRLRQTLHSPSVNKLIVNGQPALPKEFPHMALLGYGPPSSVVYSCGGSLISERWVLTAAHCVSNSKGVVTQVLLGDLNIKTEDDDARPQVVRVGQPIRHPDYVAKYNYHDIALLPLLKPAVISEYVRPACLFADRIAPGTNVTVSGWGVTDYGNEELHEMMLKAKLVIEPLRSCNRSYAGAIATPGSKLPNGLQDHQICAGSVKKADACQGDSGGPLQVFTEQSPHCMQHVVGVVSFGIFCGIGSPGVYTRVGFYMRWIEKTVWPNSKVVYRGPDKQSVPDP